MNTETRLPAALARSHSPRAGEHLLAWLPPCLFALLISATIRMHSWSPLSTLGALAVSLTALAAAVLLLSWAMGHRLTMPRDVTMLLLALGVSILVSTAGSPDPVGSLPRLLLYVALAMLATGVYLFYRDSGRLPLAPYLLAMALVHIPIVAEVVLWVRDMEPPFFQNGLRVANFAHVRQFGEAGFLAAVAAVALYACDRRWLLISLLATCVALFGIIALGSRGALLSWATCVVLLCTFGSARRRVAMMALFSLLVTALVVWSLDYSGILPTPNLFSRQGLESGLNYFSSGRIALWTFSLREIGSHPLFGLGPDGYLLSGCCDRTVAQPHDAVLQLLMEFGGVGVLLLVALMWRARNRFGGLRALGTLVFARQDLTVLASMLAAYMAYSMIDGVLYHALPLIHFALYCGLFAAGLHQTRHP